MANDVRTWYREIPVSTGIFEFFGTISVVRPQDSDYGRVEEVFREWTQGLREGISVTVFRPFDDRAADPLVARFSEFAPVADLWGRAGSYFSAIVTGYRFASERERTESFRRHEFAGSVLGTSLRMPHSTRTTIDAFLHSGMDFPDQVARFYDAVGDAMSSLSIPPERFVRSWNFVDSILSRYADFNRVRDARFAELGIRKETCPAGTGIDCLLRGPAAMSAFAEFHGDGPQGAPRIVTYKTSSQCEASSYGPKFSRAASVESGGWRRIHVSGTASVSQYGDTLNSDDIVANVAHTMETVRELLDVSGADFSHVVRSHAYLKRPEYARVFEEWIGARNLSDMPVATNVCDVCRDDWLFEFECVAFVPVVKGVFLEFRNPGEPLGNKAENCRTLSETGFPVPESLALSGAACVRIADGTGVHDFEFACRDAFGPEFRNLRYAVRSSSCSEDSATASMAGAFRSVLDVGFDALLSAVWSVRESLEGAGDFGVLIQRYVPLSVFGVTFTCDPEFAEHAMVSEVSNGAGEALVSGKNVPDRVTFSRNSPLSGLPPSGFSRGAASGIDWEAWRKRFRRIESVAGRPQDVEWGVAEDGREFVFQTRPVTTLDENDLRLLREFDRYEVENWKAAKTLVRNELAEVFDAPDESETGFLRELYRHPSVAAAYARWGVKYRPDDFLVLIGGRLFVDPEAERACFDGSLAQGRLRRAWERFRNAWRLGAVGAEIGYGGSAKLDALERDLFSVLEKALSMRADPSPRTRDEVLSALYRPVFEANFLAASHRASPAREDVAKDSAGEAYLPEDASRWAAVFAAVGTAGIVGNSLAFSDETPFSSPLCAPDRFRRGSRNVPVSSRLDFFREAGRAVSAMVSEMLRGERVGKSCEPLSRCPERLAFPRLEIRSSGALGWAELSEGSASGSFVASPDAIPADSDGPFVLFVEKLEPSLAESLDPRVVAVVSRRGGRLSHFAIVARERSLPAFQSSDVRVSEYEGKTVRVDGSGIRVIEG